jgi:hypothetical protein
MPSRTLFNRFASFRAQLVAFITCMLVLTTVVLYVTNRRSEQRIQQQVDEVRAGDDCGY